VYISRQEYIRWAQSNNLETTKTPKHLPTNYQSSQNLLATTQNTPTTPYQLPEQPKPLSNHKKHPNNFHANTENHLKRLSNTQNSPITPYNTRPL